jgi:phospholipase C
MMDRRMPARALALACVALAGCSATRHARAAGGLDQIDTIIVIYAENRSFDNLYGLFPGAEGIADAHPAPQMDNDGKTALPHLPPTPGTTIPTAGLPNAPFRIDRPPIAMPLDQRTRDLVHRFYESKEQIDGGKNDRFAAVSDAGGLTMGHYDGSALPMWRWATDFTLADHFFQGAFGGSFLNHQWLVCACTPVFAHPPGALRAKLDAHGWLARKKTPAPSALDGPPDFVTPDAAITAKDDYAVNTLQPPYQPSRIPPPAEMANKPELASLADTSQCIDGKSPVCPLPPQTQPTIGDRLNDKHVDWAWYAGAWDDAVRDGKQDPKAKRTVIANGDHGAPNFQTHHQPFNYFLNYAPGAPARAAHLKDGKDFERAIADGKLPPVAFYKPQGNLNEHAGYTDVLSGDRYIADLVKRLHDGKQWPHMAIIVTYDENGGWWDHAKPPDGDVWGPGTRIPAIVVSPFAKRHYVDHTPYDTTSILKLITRRFGLEPLPGVRRDAGDLTNAFAP